MTMVGNSVWDVYIETGLISQRAEHRAFVVLDVTAKFVFIPGKEFGMTRGWEMEDLSNHARDAVVPALDSQGSGLEEISCWSQKDKTCAIVSYKVSSSAGTTENDPFGVHAQQACVLFTLKPS